LKPGVALPQTASAAQRCAANGLADLDHSALVRSLKSWPTTRSPGRNIVQRKE
jgi:hypothetical protein